MKKILIVDDERSILDALQLILTEEGYDIKLSNDGKDALKLLKDINPHLILIDIWMPGMHGGELCRAIKKNKKTKHIPVILFSASRITRATALGSGADDYIEKPFDIKDLLKIVKKYV